MTSLLRYNLDSLTSIEKGKSTDREIFRLLIDHSFFVSLCSHVSHIVLLVVVNFNMDFFQRNFGFSSVLFDIILLLLYMTTSATDDATRLVSTRSSPTSVHGPDPHLPPDDPTSASYIPRAARMIPTSTTVHSIFIKKLSYPLSSRPDEHLDRRKDTRWY